ncbi:MAG: STAS domain-containing protein [Thermacetogeniaceae bacterium]
MKEKIVSALPGVVAELSSDEEGRRAWKDFLVEFASVCEKPDAREQLKKPVSELLGQVSAEAVVNGLRLIRSRIPDIPLDSAYEAAIEVLGELHSESQRRISELRDVLAELATPIIRLWQDVLLVPVIGTLDSQRAQSMAEKLLERTAATRARVVIVDVTGVPVIDTIVGGFLIEMFSAVKLLGSDVILTGIKPDIAHTLVKLGVDFNMVIIKRDLESALKYAISLSAEESAAVERRVKGLRRGGPDEE